MKHAELFRSPDATSSFTEGFCLAICHDLRGPLATAGAAVQELARTRDADASRRYIDIAQRSLSKADELIGTLPRLLTHGAGPLEDVGLGAIVESVRNDLEMELRQSGASLRIAHPLPNALCAPARLRIALRNLVQNAIRHRRADTAPAIVFRAWTRGASCTLTIADNGPGLRPPREAAPTRGLGLGVSIARLAIEGCGGTLSLSSHRERGTTAAVTLRLPKDPARREPETPAPSISGRRA